MYYKIIILCFGMISSFAFGASSLEKGSWSPYLAGVSIGALAWLTFRFSDKPIGASSAYATLAGLIGKKLAPAHTAALEYFKEHPPKLNWELVFVASAILGSFIAAYSGNEFEVRWVPELWEKTFGEGSRSSYAITAFIGGILMSVGSRMAGGCTSGHGISGTLQLSVASWVTVISLFVSGVLFIRLIY